MFSKIMPTALLSGTLFVLASCGGGGGGGGGTSGGNVAPRITGSTSFTFEENEIVSFNLTITDPDSPNLTITIPAGGDGAFFSVNTSTGEIFSNQAFDFENPQDADADNVYEQQITVSDGRNTVSATISVTITDVDEPPEFTSARTLDLNEGVTGDIFTFEAADPESGPLANFQIQRVFHFDLPQAYLESIFSIDADTGILTLSTPIDADTIDTSNPVFVTVTAGTGSSQIEGNLDIYIQDQPSSVTDGLIITGRSENQALGLRFSELADIDGDGLNEYWVSEEANANNLTSTDQETAYLIWGSTLANLLSTGSATLSIEDLSANQMIAFTGSPFDGTAPQHDLMAGTAENLDGDGIPDLVVSYHEAGNTSTDTAFKVVYGATLLATNTGSIDLTALDSADGYSISNPPFQDGFGLDFIIDDFNGDGVSDIFYGYDSPTSNQGSSQAYLLLGSLTAGSETRILVESSTSQTPSVGRDIALLPDVEGDGLPEIVFSGDVIDPPTNQGFFWDALYVLPSSYIVAQEATNATSIDVGGANGANGVLEIQGDVIRIEGLAANGDLDGDGYNEIVILNQDDDEFLRDVIILHGAAIRDAIINQSDFSFESNDPAVLTNLFIEGFVAFDDIEGDWPYVSFVPDLIGDAADELLIGAPSSAPFSSGRPLSGAIWLLDGAQLTGLADTDVSLDFTDLPASQGLTMIGAIENARLGRNGVFTDIDSDTFPDFLYSSNTDPTASGSSLFEGYGAFLTVNGTVIADAITGGTGQLDLAIALANETGTTP